jgi:hypothetical protein
MRWLRVVGFCLPLLVVVPVSRAESKDPAQYPLRIHIFNRQQTTFYHREMTDDVQGQGRADLFENGGVRGMDFEFNCSEKLKTSSGWETFPAKWKKPGLELVILQPQFGKPDHYTTCNLKVEMKDFAYVGHNGALQAEPVEMFQKWMADHDYDPVHGKDVPQPKKGAAVASTVPSTPPAN